MLSHTREHDVAKILYFYNTTTQLLCRGSTTRVIRLLMMRVYRSVEADESELLRCEIAAIPRRHGG